ncbi:MAG: MFS transporter [bacterium]
MQPQTKTERVYSFITGESEARVCADLPESACTNIPRNFLLNAASGTCSKLAEALANPGLVLTWLLASLGAPASLTGLLVPVRQAGSLLPQLAISGQIRRAEKRKWFWAGAGLVQAASLALMVVAATSFSGVTAGALIVAMLAVFSLASGVGSVGFNDVVGKTIPKGRRGSLLASRATSGGLLALAAGLLIKNYLGKEASLTPYLLLVGASAILWVMASILFGSIREDPGATSGGRNAFAELRAGLAQMRAHPDFAKFILARCFLLPIELALPFYALLAREYGGDAIGNLGIFLTATAMADVLSNPFWGRFADRSSRLVMILAGLLAALTGVYALGLDLLPKDGPSLLNAVMFLGIGFAQAGIRVGRKTYLINLAPKTERPLYAALANTIVGLVALAGSGLGLLAEAYSLQLVIVILIALPLVGALISLRLPNLEEKNS